MSFWGKVKQVAEPAAQVAQVIAPATPAGQIAKIVERVISNPNDPNNEMALRSLANEIVNLQMRVDHLEQVITRKR